MSENLRIWTEADFEALRLTPEDWKRAPRAITAKLLPMKILLIGVALFLASLLTYSVLTCDPHRAYLAIRGLWLIAILLALYLIRRAQIAVDLKILKASETLRAGPAVSFAAE